MASGGGKPPSAPDPNVIIPLQSQYNRYGSSGPFGSQTWQSGGPGGHETLNTQLSPQMQGAVDRAFSAAQVPYQREYVPQGLDQLTSGILGRVGSHYGLSGSGLNTNLQQQKPQGMSPQPPQGMPNVSMQPPGGMGGPQSMGAMPPAGQSPLGLQMGGQNGGFTGANPLAAMAALQGGGQGGMPNVAMQQPGQMPLQRMGY